MNHFLLLILFFINQYIWHSINVGMIFFVLPVFVGVISQLDIIEPEELTGNTLEVYNLLMEMNEWVGVREVQRILKYSSPNLAYYHLNKLYELDLADKSSDNKYAISQKGINMKYGPYQDRFSFMGNWISEFYIFFLLFGIISLLSLGFLILEIPSIVWFIIYFPITISLTLFYWVRARKLENLPEKKIR